MTTDRAALLMDLADRCEKATGPDRELDARIYILTAGGSAADADYAATDPDVTCKPPRFTASLDAALTLVPECADWLLRSRCSNFQNGFYAHIMQGDVNRAGRTLGECFAATPALALCAAALRALASGAPR